MSSKTDIFEVVKEIQKYLLEKYNPVKLLHDCSNNKEFSKWVCTSEFLKDYLSKSNSETLKTKNNTYIDALRLYVDYTKINIPNLSNITNSISESYDESRFVDIEEEIAISYAEGIENPEGLNDEYVLTFFRYYYLPDGKFFVFFFVNDKFTPDVNVSGVLMSKQSGAEIIKFYDDLFTNSKISDEKLNNWVSVKFGSYIYIPGSITYKGKPWDETSYYNSQIDL